MRKILIPNGTDAVEAEYKNQVIDEYKGNPFIEALPDILPPEDVVRKLTVYPPYSDEERNLDAHYRIHLAQKLFQAFQPLPRHLDLESRISRVIRQGYIPRNPVSREYVISFKEGYKAIQNADINSNQHFRSTGCGFTIIGVSGMGKSVSINRVLSLYPQVIVHNRYKERGFSFYQLVWLKLDCPFDGSVKGLCIDFFNKADLLLGTDFYRKVANSKKPVDYMLTLMSQVVRSTGLGVLIIDEVQHLCGVRGYGDERMLNFFVTLVNTAGVPVILIGNPKAMSILQSEFRQARRGSGQGDMVYDRLQQDESYNLLVESLWQYQWTRKESILANSMKDVIYEESQGIIDIICKLIVMSQTVAISSGKEQVDEALIRKVAKEHFQLVRPMLQALKSDNIREIAKYSDICTIDIESNKVVDQGKVDLEVKKRMKAMKEQKEAKDKESRVTKEERLLEKLIELGINVPKAKKAIENVIQAEGQDLDDGKLVIKAIQFISGDSTTKKTKKSKVETKSEHDVRCIVEEGRKQGKSAHQSLTDKGYIKKSEDDTLFKVV